MRISSIYLIGILGLLHLIIGFGIVISGLGNITFAPIDPISILSLITFAVLCVIALLNERAYLIILVFIIIAFPSAVNNFIPGVYLGDPTELGASIFPLLTHLDIYLFLGILRFVRNRIDLNVTRAIPPILIALFLMFISFVVNILDSSSNYEALLLVTGGYQFRYLILILFILLILKNKSLDDIALGLSISLVFLLVESSIFTTLNQLPSLESGSLATNTFGNIVAQISMFLIYYSARYKRLSLFRLYILGVALTGLLMALLTGTRMSIFSVLMVYFTIWIYKRITVSHIVKVTGLVVILTVTILSFDLHNTLPAKFKVWEIIDWEKISVVMDEEGAIETKVPRTPESSSIITRLQLFRTSFRMIGEDPFWGLGAGRWNYLKSDFGFDIPVLIDSHNGFLALLSQYGIVGGVSLILFLLITPTVLFLSHIRRQKDIKLSRIWLLGIISLGMSFCEFSNAGVFKPQVYGLLAFIAIILLAERKKEILSKKTQTDASTD